MGLVTQLPQNTQQYHHDVRGKIPIHTQSASIEASASTSAFDCCRRARTQDAVQCELRRRSIALVADLARESEMHCIISALTSIVDEFSHFAIDLAIWEIRASACR